MTKKRFLIFSILLFSINAFSQAITQKSIVGKWKVVAVLSKIDNPNLKDIVRGFKASTFDFNESSAINLTTTDNSKLFSMITAMINKSKWRLKENNFVVEVGSESDNYNIMKIIITEVNDKIIFHLDETELDLQVVKQQIGNLALHDYNGVVDSYDYRITAAGVDFQSIELMGKKDNSYKFTDFKIEDDLIAPILQH